MSMQGPENAYPKTASAQPNDVDRHVGKGLRYYRERVGWLPSQVAKGLQITEAQVAAFEAGQEHVSASRLFEFGQLLDVPVAYFFAPEDL